MERMMHLQVHLKSRPDRYLNTASYGLPPTPAWDALQAVLEDWRGGRTSWEGWGDSTESARASFARLVGVPTDWIAIGANTSSMVGLVAASLPVGARVVSAEPEFTSLLWPFLAQERGIEVECAPVAGLADHVDDSTDEDVRATDSARPANPQGGLTPLRVGRRSGGPCAPRSGRAGLREGDAARHRPPAR
jgi:selenocysteine lyase/cysteine desulfurase